MMKDFQMQGRHEMTAGALSRVVSAVSGGLTLLSILASCSSAQTTVRQGTATIGERRAELNLQTARQNPLQLRRFLLELPKGADLHNHLSGAVYAESWIRAGVEDHLCVDRASAAFVKPAGGSSHGDEQECEAGQVPASTAYHDQHLFDALVDSFSMRGFVPSTGVTAHDHFFEAFDKFRGTDHRHLGEWVDEVVSRAAAQNEQYMELMHTPSFPRTTELAKKIGWREDFASMRDEFLAGGLREDVGAAKGEIDQAEEIQRGREHCGQPDAARPIP